ncbi:MAG TPA: hypothetical protein VGD40_07395 [Chryseosolibacter sp.]
MLRLTLFSICSLMVLAAYAQPMADTSAVVSAVKSLRTKYYQEKLSESFLAIGSDYLEYNPIEDEHPYFNENDWIMGSVKYNEIVYENVPLLYDIRLQKILTEHPASGKKIELVKENVSWFKFANHHFGYLPQYDAKVFYERLADGTAKLWATHSKNFQESTVTGKVTVRTEEQTRYFIENDGRLFPVKGKSSVLEALHGKRELLQQELKRNRVNFNRNKPNGLIEAVRLYNAIP